MNQKYEDDVSLGGETASYEQEEEEEKEEEKEEEEKEGEYGLVQE